MTDATTRIKNLSIALARLPRKDFPGGIERLYGLLSHEITKLEEENSRHYAPPAEPESDQPQPTKA